MSVLRIQTEVVEVFQTFCDVDFFGLKNCTVSLADAETDALWESMRGRATAAVVLSENTH